MPVPIMRTIHSSKFFGLVWALVRASRAASIMPSMQRTCSFAGSMEMLFWKGYGTQRFWQRTYEMRWCVYQSSARGRASSMQSSKYL